MRCDKSAPRRGFTLVEALVALAIVGLAIVAAIEASSAGLWGQRRAARHLEAVTLAEARLSELAILSGDSITYYQRVRRGTFPIDGRDYRWSAIVHRPEDEPTVVSAAVLVEWDEGQYSLETTFYRPDLDPDPLRRRRR